jgi:hypothetical protein
MIRYDLPDIFDRRFRIEEVLISQSSLCLLRGLIVLRHEVYQFHRRSPPNQIIMQWLNNRLSAVPSSTLRAPYSFLRLPQRLPLSLPSRPRSLALADPSTVKAPRVPRKAPNERIVTTSRLQREIPELPTGQTPISSTIHLKY